MRELTSNKAAETDAKDVRTLRAPLHRPTLTIMFRFTVALLLLALTGCASNSARYAVDGGPKLSRAQADAQYAKRVSELRGKLDRPLKALYAPFPDYPRELRNAGITGTVRVLFTIDREGRARNARAVGGAPAGLVDVALENIQRWRFDPPIAGGVPVEIEASQVFEFNLE